MLGAIAGDIIGSVYENVRTKRKDFRLFTPLSIYTDDTVLTTAVADAILGEKTTDVQSSLMRDAIPCAGMDRNFCSGCSPRQRDRTTALAMALP